MAVAVALAATIAGVAAGSGSPLIAGLIAALIGGMSLMFAPLALLWLVIVGSTTLAGLASLYAPEAGPLHWGFVIAAAFLGIAAIVRHMLDTVRAGPRPSRQFDSLLFWALTYIGVVVLSTIHGGGASFGSVVGLKNHFQVWGILFAFMLIPMTIRHANAFVNYLVVLGFIQFVPVLHQYLVLAPQRRGLTQVDVVVGTFVGNVFGGGAVPLLAIVEVICVAMVAGLWRRGVIGGFAAITGSFFLLIPTLLGEAKIVLVILPIAVCVVFWDYLRRRFAVMMLLIIGMVPVLTGILWMQSNVMREHGGAKDLESFVQRSIDYNIGNRGYGNYVLNRGSVYSFWWAEHGLRDPLGTLIGHGAGASRDSNVGLSDKTLAKIRYPGYGIGLTGVSALLWETGVLGLVAIVAMFVSAFRLAGRLAAQVEGSQTGMNMRCAQAGLAVFAASLLHNEYIVFELGYQTILMLLMGYVAAVARGITISRDAMSAKKDGCRSCGMPRR